MAFTSGDRIGDYEILAPLGAGGMGSVYKVRHTISERVEALKVILPHSPATPEIAERFLREIRLQASLEHRHIAALHNAFRRDDELVMVMEFVEGASLRDKLRSPGITLAQTLEYAAQVLEALDYAHARGVIHRDIKPSNVMIASHGMVKLLDFGLAATSSPGRDSELTRPDLTQPELTKPGTLLGSPYYLSPEQARGERADARSDLYSTGAMLYEMVAGRPPFEAPGSGGAYAVIAAHLNQAPVSPAEVNPRVPAELARAILKALAKAPAERFQSAAEFLTSLEMLRKNASRLDETATVTTRELETFAYSDAELDRVSKTLAAFVGPIAQILVRRAARGSRGWGDLYQSLAQEISSSTKREQFLATMPPLSRSASGTPSGGSQTSG